MGRKVNSGLCLGTIGQLNLQNFELAAKLMLQKAMIGDITLNHIAKDYLVNLSHRTDKDVNDFFDIIGHDTTKSIQVISSNNKVVNLSHRDLAKILKNNSSYKKGKSIRLLSCNTGKDPLGFAQNLANKLNVKVIAPNTYYWAYPNGKHLAAGMKSNGQIDENQPGQMITFYPGGNKK